jgi:hypothetical protein
MQTGNEEVGAVPEESLETTPETEVIEETTEETTNESEPQIEKDETVRDTVKRALEEEKAKVESPDKEELKPDKPVSDPLKAPKKAKKQQQQAPEFKGPPRFNAAEKEALAKAPAEVQLAIGRMVQEHEAKFTKTQQQLSYALQEAGAVAEAAKPLLMELADRGIPASLGIQGLVAAHQKLINPATATDKVFEIINTSPVDKQRLLALLQGEEPGSDGTATVTPDIAQHPQFVAMQTQLNTLLSQQQQVEQQRFNQTVQSITSEMEAVQMEKDQFGRFRYPKLHEPEFLDKVKPLVSALVGNVPGLSYAEALKRAYWSIEGQSTGNSDQQNQTRLPESNNQQRALSAAVSVRGKSSPGATGLAIPDKIPDSVRDTVRMALEQLRRAS